MHEGGTMADHAPPVNQRSGHPATISPHVHLVGAIQRIEFPDGWHRLDVVGFDTTAPAVVADFVRS